MLYKILIHVTVNDFKQESVMLSVQKPASLQSVVNIVYNAGTLWNLVSLLLL